MMQYADLIKLPNQKTYSFEYCAMCGNNISYVLVGKREYNYCTKCKVVKSYLE